MNMCVWSGERQTKNLQSGVGRHRIMRRVVGEEGRPYHCFIVSMSMNY